MKLPKMQFFNEVKMKRNNITLLEVKQKIQELQGKNISMEVNKGRNRIVKLDAIIDKVYPSMFVIKPTQICDLDRTSYSYNDILCGDIVIND